MVQGILDLVTRNAAELATGVSRFQADTGPMLAGVDAIRDREAFASLLQAFKVATLSLHQTVDVSRRELDETRRRLAEVTGELRRSEELARTDPLTGFCNRRAMDEIVTREIARARRSGDPFCVAILDIDHFKEVNDDHGHGAGDQALVHVALVVKSGIRETDVICRHGGEEFVIVLPGASAEGARFVIDRLRLMVEKTPLVLGKGRVTLRFSAGVAEWRPQDRLDGLLERADQALYAAKRAGRNRVVVAGADPAAPQGGSAGV
jgi:diguanylate cyclase